MMKAVKSHAYVKHPLDSNVELRKVGLTIEARCRVDLTNGHYHSTISLGLIMNHYLFDNPNKWHVDDVRQVMCSKEFTQVIIFRKRF